MNDYSFTIAVAIVGCGSALMYIAMNLYFIYLILKHREKRS